MLSSRKGFTLIELIVVMAVFMAVIIITADSFNLILTHMTKLMRSEESNIEGVVGLEMFRHDLQQTGYGLPFAFSSPISYLEAGYAPSNSFNDGTGATSSKVPRAMAAGNDLLSTTPATSDGTNSFNFLPGTDYLALKATLLGLNAASQKWTYVNYSSVNPLPKIWPSENLKGTATADRVIVVRRAYNSAGYVNELVTGAGAPGIYWATYDPTGFADATFNPTLPGSTHYIYGIKNGDPLGMPFNRADYFVAKPPEASGKLPSVCEPGSTGILYKGVLNHSSTNPGGRLTVVPLLDCVADMQVVFGWDVDDGQGNEGQDGIIETYSSPGAIDFASTVPIARLNDATTGAFNDAEKMRTSLKIIKIYILAQVGRRNPNYQSPASYKLGDVTNNGGLPEKVYTLTAAQRNYHWKVYRIVVRPKNLLTNQ